MNRFRRAIPWILAVFSALIALLAVGDVVAGIAFEPTTAQAISGMTMDEIRAESSAGFTVIDYIYRSNGLALISLGVLLTIVLAIPYRRGEAWAWGAAWVLPAWSAAVFLIAVVHGPAPGQAISGVAWSGIGIAVITAALLLLDLPRFRTESNPLTATAAAA